MSFIEAEFRALDSLGNQISAPEPLAAIDNTVIMYINMNNI